MANGNRRRFGRHCSPTFGGLPQGARSALRLRGGSSLATLHFASVGRGVMLASFHLLMASATAFGLASLFGFAGTERGVFILMCLMPSSVGTYLFVELYTPAHAQDVASLIMVSTLMTVLVLPIVMTYGL